MPTFEGVEGNENRNKERNIGGIFFSAINVGEVFCYDVEDKI